MLRGSSSARISASSGSEFVAGAAAGRRALADPPGRMAEWLLRRRSGDHRLERLKNTSVQTSNSPARTCPACVGDRWASARSRAARSDDGRSLDDQVCRRTAQLVAPCGRQRSSPSCRPPSRFADARGRRARSRVEAAAQAAVAGGDDHQMDLSCRCRPAGRRPFTVPPTPAEVRRSRRPCSA